MGDVYKETLRRLELEVSVSCAAGAACAACLAAAAAAWALAPRWRTLHNFVSLNQIANATVVQCLYYLVTLNILHTLVNDWQSESWVQHIFHYRDLILQIYRMSRLSMSCWSLFATAYAYIKLVHLHRHRISGEKTIAFVMTYGLAAVIKVIIYFVAKILCKDRRYRFCNYNFEYILQILVSCIISALILMLFIRICVSVMWCRAAAVSHGSRRRAMALVGVAVMCDVFDLLHGVLYYDSIFSQKYVKNTYSMVDVLLLLRVVPQTIFVLCKKSSRDHFNVYFRRMRNRITNGIQLNNLF